MAVVTRSGRFVQTRTTGLGTNVHRSNRAKNGLYHGKDIQFGNNVSHSMRHTRRRWNPNVQNKRVFSEALDDFVRFKMTTRAMKAIDDCGGIDNYMLQLDEKLVEQSNYLMKMRELIANTLFHKGALADKFVKKMQYDKYPPPALHIEFVKADGKYGKWHAFHAGHPEGAFELEEGVELA
eukprot:GSChrysophyteH1.ASY1.ANO1.3159.1 assembled CDS